MLFNSLIESISASWHLFFQDPKLYFTDNISNYIEIIVLSTIFLAYFLYNRSISKTKNFEDFVYLLRIKTKVYFLWFFGGVGLLYFFISVRCIVLLEFYTSMVVDYVANCFVYTTHCGCESLFRHNTDIAINHVLKPAGYFNFKRSEVFSFLSGLKVNLEAGNPNDFHIQLKTPTDYFGRTNFPAAIGDRITVERCLNTRLFEVTYLVEDKICTSSTPYTFVDLRLYLERYLLARLAVDYIDPIAYECAVKEHEQFLKAFYCNDGKGLVFSEHSTNPYEKSWLTDKSGEVQNKLEETKQLITSTNTDLILPGYDRVEKPTCFNQEFGLIGVELDPSHPIVVDWKDILYNSQLKKEGVGKLWEIEKFEIKFSHEAANVSPNTSHNYNDFKAQVKNIRAIGYNG